VQVVDTLPNYKVIIGDLKGADMIWILNLRKGGQSFGKLKMFYGQSPSVILFPPDFLGL
jgi:hypothetical protein